MRRGWLLLGCMWLLAGCATNPLLAPPAHHLPADWQARADQLCSDHILERFQGEYRGNGGDFNAEVFVQSSRQHPPRRYGGLVIVVGNMGYPEGTVRTRGLYECRVDFSRRPPRVWLESYPLVFRQS